MRKIAFCVFFIGLTIIIGIILFTRPVEIENYSDIENLKINTHIALHGGVREERINDGFLILKINDISILCRDCEEGYVENNVFVDGIVTEYERTKEITAFAIKIMN